MRVSLVSPFDPFPAGRDARAHLGGVERVYAALAEGLAGRGHEVRVVCSSDHDGGGREPPGVDVTRVRRRGTVMRTPIASLADALPPSDIVHVAATYPFVTPSVIRRARADATPCVLDFHFEPDPVTALGRLAASAYRLVGPRSYPLADAVLVRSHAYGASAGSLAAVPRSRWTELPNGIDPTRFKPGGPRRGDGHLLFVGRLVPYKGVDVLLQALALVDEAPPLWIVGDGPQRSRLEVLAQRLGVDARFLGSPDDEDLPALYRGASLTVLPSVGQQECFGITLLESMACGTPVVGSDIPGVGAIARLGGMVAPAGRPRALAHTIERALTSDLARGPALARDIHAAFSWDAVTDRLDALYTDLLTRHRAAFQPAPGRPYAHPRSDAVLRT